MKRLRFIILLAAMLVVSAANATVLFPMFNDLAPNNEVVFSDDDEKGFKQVVYKGDSGFGGFDTCVSFMNDVIPEDVTKSVTKNIAVYVSPYKEKEIDTIDGGNRVCAIYILDRGGKVEIYYTESDGVQQKTWEQAITEGKM